MTNWLVKPSVNNDHVDDRRRQREYTAASATKGQPETGMLARVDRRRQNHSNAMSRIPTSAANDRLDPEIDVEPLYWPAAASGATAGE